MSFDLDKQNIIAAFRMGVILADKDLEVALVLFRHAELLADGWLHLSKKYKGDLNKISIGELTRYVEKRIDKH